MMDRLGGSSKKYQETCPIACSSGSHGSLTMLGLTVRPFVQSSEQQQTTLHMDLSRVSDPVMLDGQSLHDGHMCK